MKKIYTTLVFCLLMFVSQAQTFDYSISFIGLNGGTDNYQMALVATPSASLTDGSTADMGAGFYLPSGITIGNFVTGDSGIPGSEWSSMALGSNANGDGIFISRVEAGTMSVDLNGSGPFQLAVFDIIADPNPMTDSITFMENGDTLLVNNFVENYINIDFGAGPVNAYNQNDSGANSIDFSSLGLDDVKLLDYLISIYPNPTSDVINIESQSIIDTVEMFDLLGKQVLVTQKTEQIKVSQLPTGVYLLKIYTSEGSLTKKVIIE